ncbi:MAG: class I SAM-dependent methyltransferase [Bacteroidetes bacterium]|nr:class I SAM-dependent methyltransferase [Bacteroidota bacterium]
MSKLYPDSKVEVQGFEARNYDATLNIATGGIYARFIRQAIRKIGIQEGERILDIGCGTGRNACLMMPHLGSTGYFLGMDISEDMRDQFRRKCAAYPNAQFRLQRADIPFREEQPFDRVFMSFVLHGFPHEVRLRVLKNIHTNLVPGGKFSLLDFGHFTVSEMSFFPRKLFTTVECPYAFDFVERDWHTLLSDAGFDFVREDFWFHRYVRLLTVQRNEG